MEASNGSVAMSSASLGTVVPDWGELPRAAEASEPQMVLRNNLRDASIAAIKKRGTATKYLAEVMPSPAEKRGFLEWLLKTFTMQDDLRYCIHGPIPAVEKEKIGTTLPQVLHVGHFAWGTGCSVKSSTGQNVSLEQVGKL